MTPSNGSPRGPLLAALGGAASLAATVLLPFHLGGGFGLAIAVGFLLGGALLALASIDLASRFRRDRGGRWIRVGANLGAAGFLVSGLGLVADVAGRPVVPVETVAIAATAAWWAAVARALRDRRRWFALFSAVAAASALAAIAAQALWEAPAGAVPARFAYVVWGPWGIWLAALLARGGPGRGGG